MAGSEGPARRPLIVTVLLLAAAAAAIAGSSASVWLRPSFDTAFRGQVTVSVTGGDWEASLLPLALLALAGVPAAVATGGWLRRLVGLMLAASGIWATVLGLRPQVGAPPEYARLEAMPGVPASGQASEVLVIEPWSLLASLGGMLLLAAGVLLVVRAGGMARLGARYAAPGRRRHEPDPDRGLWEALDAGNDPT